MDSSLLPHFPNCIMVLSGAHINLYKYCRTESLISMSDLVSPSLSLVPSLAYQICPLFRLPSIFLCIATLNTMRKWITSIVELILDSDTDTSIVVLIIHKLVGNCFILITEIGCNCDRSMSDYECSMRHITQYITILLNLTIIMY